MKLYVLASFILTLNALTFAQEFEIIGVYESEGTISDMQVIGNHAYLASGDAGFEIIDLDDPENPNRVGHYADFRSACQVAVCGDNAFVYFFRYPEPRCIKFLDISDIENPQFMGSYSPELWFVHFACSDSYIYTTHSYMGTDIVDVTDPGDPVVIGNIPAPDTLYGTGTTYVFADPPYCYVGNSNQFMWYGIVQFVNIENPAQPEILYEDTTSTFSTVVIQDTIGYVVSSAMITYIDIYNISDPSNPLLIGQYSRGYQEDTKFIYDFCIIDNLAYALFGQYGGNWFEVYDLTDLSDPFLLHTFDLGDDINCIESYGEYFIIADDNQLKIMRSIPTDIRENPDNTLPKQKSFLNHPNPFNAQTTISFSLEKPGNVEISIYDITGRLVEVLTSQAYNAGNHSLVWDAAHHPSGIYFVRLNGPYQTKYKKMALLK